MPEVFQKDCELKVIEYGSTESLSDIMSDVKDTLSTMIKA